MNTKHKTAFTLIELLMSLMILGMLMAAVAVAFDASVKNYQANEGIYRTVNTGRQALLRITNDVRIAQAVASIGIGTGFDSLTELTLKTPDNQDITYRFDSSTNELRLYTADDDYLLCRNVTLMSFNRFPHNIQPVRNVRIKMELADPGSGVTQTLVAAAVVRRNIGD